MNGPSVPGAIVGLLAARVIVCCRWRCRGLEFVEHAVKVEPVEDEAAPLAHRRQLRAPHIVEGAALDADVLDGLGMGQAAFHGLILLNSTTHTHGFAAQLLAPLICSQMSR